MNNNFRNLYYYKIKIKALEQQKDIKKYGK